MKLGCFALLDAFAPLGEQFQKIRSLGIDRVDVTDSHDGASLSVEYGFHASVSLDSRPAALRRLAADYDVKLSAVCAHANLLDPPGPDVYSTNQIIKAIRLAKDIRVPHIITTEGEPRTKFGRNLNHEQRLFAISERLYEPIQWAEDLGVEILIEPHGIVTDSADSMADLLSVIGHRDTIGICLDTGNSWLGGGEPLDFVERFSDRIKHVHWKDLDRSWISQRSQIFGCGMSKTALGDGVIGVQAVLEALLERGYDGDMTLEIHGDDAIRKSVERLHEWSRSFIGSDADERVLA